MKRVPPQLLHGPFTRRQAMAAGVSKSMLQGRRFVRIHPCVWRHVDHEMSHADRIEAARMVMPSAARTTGITRLQQLGLVGPCVPVIEGVFLHRTKIMPPPTRSV